MYFLSSKVNTISQSGDFGKEKNLQFAIQTEKKGIFSYGLGENPFIPGELETSRIREKSFHVLYILNWTTTRKTATIKKTRPHFD